MVEYEICPKCNHKQMYYRSAFGSWRCAYCLFEKDNADRTGTVEHMEAERWWNYLKPTEKVNIFKSFHKSEKVDNNLKGGKGNAFA